MAQLGGKAVVVTGGANGIGRVMVLALLRAGAKVCAVDRDAAALATLAGEVPGAALHALALDLAEPDSGQRAIDHALEALGGIDALVNNAGIGRASFTKDIFGKPPKFWEVAPEIWTRFVEINASAVFRLSSAAARQMIRAGWGRIVTVTTSLDSMIRGGMAPYGPSKAAAESLTAIMANDLQHSGVTANVLIPGGPTDTAMIPVTRDIPRDSLLQPGIMVPPLLWLLSDEAAGVTGRRFRACLWDPHLPPREAAERSGAPIAWTSIAMGQTRQPGGAPKG